MENVKTARIINGKEIAAQVRAELKSEIQALKERTGVIPGLTVVLVGENPASVVYVRNKVKACEEVGIRSTQHKLPGTTTQAELLKLIKELNASKEVHGILVQLPLPKQINEEAILEEISPLKDVDGFHPYNMGRLMIGNPLLQPCTPFGVMRLIESTGIDLAGKEAVVVGRSNIVGKPMAMMLLRRNATVTICHSKTRDLGAVTRQADILVAAIGRARFLTGDMVKPGAVVIDVGINRLPHEKGKLVGDVDFQSVLGRA